MEFGWDWWFDGTNPYQGQPDWSQEDVQGGGFYLDENFGDYYHRTWDDSAALSAIDEYLHSGYGTTLGVYSETIGHSVTVWGFEHAQGDPTDYTGIWITDSDDDKNDPTPEDELRYYDVNYSGGKWFLQNFYGYNDIYIGEVQALEPIPEPMTLLLLGFGAVMLRKKRN